MGNQAAQGTGTELRIESLVGQFLQGFIRPGEFDLNLFFQTLTEAFQEDGCDTLYLVFLQSLEDDDIVDTVEKFRTEVLFEEVTDLLVGLVRNPAFPKFMRTEVTGHDDDGVLEVDDPALAVGQAAVVENLQEDVEDVGMSLSISSRRMTL